MGFFDKLKGEFIDIVEFVDDSQDTLVYKFDRYGNEIKNGAQLIVREGQVAIFINEGKFSGVGDVFTPGRYQLTTQNLPILSTLMGWKYGFESPFKAEVFFVSSKVHVGRKWGTKNPITMRDADFGIVRVRAFGAYSIKISDPKKVITDISGTNSEFSIEDIEEQFRSMVVTEFTDALGELKVPVLDLAQNYKELGSKIEGLLNKEFNELGFEVKKFLIENISLPPEVEAAIDKRTAMGAIGNLDQFTKFQTATAIENASKNPGSGMGDTMGAAMGMAMGFGMMNQMQGQQGQGQQGQGQGQGMGATPPPLSTSVQFFVAVNGQQQGPYTLDQLKAFAGQGQFTKDHMVWKQGMANWIKAGEVPEIASLFGSAPPPLPA